MESLDFIEFAGLLKKVERFKDQTYFKDFGIERYESVADHTWRMLLVLCLISEKLSTEFDFTKVTKMIVIHDLPEIKTGDLSPLGESGTGKDAHAFDQKKKQDKQEAEEMVAKEIFASQPEFFALWEEIEEMKTFEAKLVKAIDTLEGRMQAIEYLREAPYYAQEHFEFNRTYKVEIFDIDPYLQELRDKLLSESEEIFKVKPQQLNLCED